VNAASSAEAHEAFDHGGACNLVTMQRADESFGKASSTPAVFFIHIDAQHFSGGH
jgi:hypothetical protein